jgi:hypothetical protein
MTCSPHRRFRWPRAEFQLALRARDQYLLYLVYEADTLSPTIVAIRDPLSRFQTGDLELGLDSLAGDVGTLPGADPTDRSFGVFWGPTLDIETARK